MNLRFYDPYNWIDELFFWSFKDHYGKTHYGIDDRQSMINDTINFIAGKDDEWEAFRSIGFGTQEDYDAIMAEWNSFGEDEEEFLRPVLDAFTERGLAWLRTDEGLIAALNYDANREGLIIPLREAIENPDALPIYQSQFKNLLIDQHLAIEEDED